MPTPRRHLSVITRLPEPGASKTRLVPALGADGAADLQRRMTEHVVRQARIAAATAPLSLDVRLAGGSEGEARRWLGVPASPQGDGDLGARLERALAAGLGRSEVAAVLGGDCPTVDAADIREAFTAAETVGAAIIPSADGGFCLLAMGRTHRAKVQGLLDGIEWGTAGVFAATLARLRGARIETAVLPERADIDTPEDLPAWEALRAAWYEPPRVLAVVVPTLNEAERLPAILEALAREGVEAMVADGGSTDGTPAIALASGARVVEAPAGRARQMNAGAAAAAACGADALLFLHADSRVPEHLREAVLGALSDPAVALGAFSFALDGTGRAYRLLEAGTNWRARRLGMPYGDQGLFLRTVAFRALGGFPDLPVMEDYEFVRRARRTGRVAISPERLVTSDRRWRALGTWRCTALNLATVLRYHLGATPDQLAAWRRRHSKR